MATQTDPTHTKHITTSDGTKYGYIYYPPQAGKPTLLMLHGFPSATWDWRFLLPLLSSEGVGIIAPDLLGYGDTDKPHEVAAYRMKNISDQVVSICEAEGAKKVIGVAHDWGCGLLSHMWVYIPQLFDKLVFISVGYLPPGKDGLDVDAINALTKPMYGYEIFGYWHFFNSEDAPEVIAKHHDSFSNLCFPKDPEVWKHSLAETGALRNSLETEKGKSIESLSTAADLKVHADILLSGGYRGPTNWYKQAMRKENDADYDKMAPGAVIVTIPTLYVATLRDAICVPSFMQVGMKDTVKDLTTKEVDASHWGILEKPKEIFEHIKAFSQF